MNELLAPKLQDIRRLYVDQYVGMTRIDASLNDLLEVQHNLADTIVHALDDSEKEFLVSVKRGEPELDLLKIDHLDQLPSIRWKIINIRKMDPVKHKAALDRLIKVVAK